MRSYPIKSSVYAFLLGIQETSNRRDQHQMWRLCEENRRLGGTVWKKVLRRYGLTEKQVFGGGAT